MTSPYTLIKTKKFAHLSWNLEQTRNIISLTVLEPPPQQSLQKSSGHTQHSTGGMLPIIEKAEQ